MYVLIMDKCQTCFEEGVVFFCPSAIERISDYIAIMHFAENEAIDKGAFILN